MRHRVAQVDDSVTAAIDLLPRSPFAVAAQACALLAHDAIAVGQRLHRLLLGVGTVGRRLHDALAAQFARGERDVSSSPMNTCLSSCGAANSADRAIGVANSSSCAT